MTPAELYARLETDAEARYQEVLAMPGVRNKASLMGWVDSEGVLVGMFRASFRELSQWQGTMDEYLAAFPRALSTIGGIYGMTEDEVRRWVLS